MVLATQIPMVIYNGDFWPSDGISVITDDAGIGGGSTMARLAALSSTTYRVEADTNGDGLYHWDSGIQMWDAQGDQQI